MALLSRPRPCQAGRGEGFYIAAWTGLTEQPFEQRHENHTDERHTAAGHKLFHALRFCTWIIISVSFQQVDHAPDSETCAKGDDQSLQNIDCAIEEIHILCAGIVSLWFLRWKPQSRNELAAVCGCRFRLLLSNIRLCFPPTLRFAYCRCIVGRPPLRNGCLKNLYEPPVQAGACVSDTSASKTSNSSSGCSFSRVERYFSTSKAFLGFASERYL